MRIPFDWRNPIGYALAVTLESIYAINLMWMVGCIASFGFGCHLNAATGIKELESGAHEFNEFLEINKDPLRRFKYFVSLIDWYSNLKQLSGKNFKIYDYFSGCK